MIGPANLTGAMDYLVAPIILTGCGAAKLNRVKRLNTRPLAVAVGVVADDH
jgi:hypothetical protein